MLKRVIGVRQEESKLAEVEAGWHQQRINVADKAIVGGTETQALDQVHPSLCSTSKHAERRMNRLEIHFVAPTLGAANS